MVRNVNRMTLALIDGDWQDTVNNAHPGVTLMWLESFRLQLSRLSSDQSFTISQALSTDDGDMRASLPPRRLVLALFITFTSLVAYGLLRRLYNDFIAIAAIILIAFDPFLIYRSRLFRPDGLAATLMLLGALTVLLYAKEQKKGWLIAGGVLGGLAALTKITSLYLLPFTGLVLLLWPWLNHRSQQNGEPTGRYINPLSKRGLWNLVRDVFWWASAFGLTFIVFWPALWVSPLNVFDVIYGFLRYAGTGDIWQGDAHFFYQGQVVKDDPGISFYLWALAYRTTPIVWLGVVLALISATRNALGYASTLLFFAYCFFFFVAMSLGATKADRYLLPIFPGLIILAAVGYFYLINQFKLANLKKWGVMGALLIGSAWFSLPHHPYYSTYWNPLLGGGRQAVEILPVVSAEGVDVLVDYLNSLPNNAEINLTGAYFGYFCPPNFAGKCLNQTQFLESDYFITFLFPIQWQLTNLSDPLSIIPDAKLVKKFTKDGADYAWLYKMPEGLQNVDQQFDKYRRFHGYRLSETEIGAGDTLDVTLFWQNDESGPQLGDSEFFVKLLNQIGEVQQIVPAQLLPEFTADMPYLETTRVSVARINLPPHISPGIYHLEIGLRSKTTGEETKNFPLTNSDNTIVVNRGALNVSADELPIQYRLDSGQSQGLESTETGLALLGYDLTSNSTPRFDFYWRAERSITKKYLLNLDLLDGNGQTVASWSNWLSSPLHPLMAWQPGEVIKLPWPQEVGYSLSPDSYQPVLTIFAVDNQASSVTPASLSPLAMISLPDLPKDFSPVRPDIEMQHHLDNVTFGSSLDLLGYTLEGQGSAANGTLYVTLYWLNRQPSYPVEAQVQILDEYEHIIARQILPVQPPANLLTWRSVSYYELPLTNLPKSITIAVRPIDTEAWYQVQASDKPMAEQVVIDDVLGKTIIVLD